MKDIKRKVIERINRIPKDVRISIDLEGIYSPDEIVEHINLNDEVGKKIVQIESEYIKENE